MKKRIKWVISILMSLVLMLCAAVPAFSAVDSAEPFKPELKQGENIELSITPDKSSYSWNDTVTFTVNIKNITGQTLAPLSIEVFAETNDLFLGDITDGIYPGSVDPDESKNLEFRFYSRNLSTFEKIFVAPIYSLKSFFNGLFKGYDEYILTTDIKVGYCNYTFGIKAGYQETPDNYTENIDEIVALYNKAYKATVPAPVGQSTMKLDGEITGEGDVGEVLGILSPAANKALQKNSVATNYIPGNGGILADDVVAATASTINGVTTVYIQLKDQTDGSSADRKSGPVGRGIGTVGSVDAALKELGAEITSGRDTIELTYTDAYIKCTIDNSTGAITGGVWRYIVKLYIGDVNAKMGISFNIKNLNASIDYKVVI